MHDCWSSYQHKGYDELVDKNNVPRSAAAALSHYLEQLSEQNLKEIKLAADLAIKQMGITFTVYSDGENIDREWPFDIIPRVIEMREWTAIELGLKQRLQALNLFIDDLYNDQRIVKDKVFPAALLKSSINFRAQCIGMSPPHGVWAHICGSDLVRGADGTMYVLEDNLRVPSGVSYMIENREIMKRAMPELFGRCPIQPIDDYTDNLQKMLNSLSSRADPRICVLTPGVHNSAYFEHAFLAQRIGATLAEGRDLLVEADDCLYVRNVEGLQRIDVVYRRVDDEFIDPECFKPESVLGARGLMRAWRAGNVAIANAPGAGVADDKVVYTYVPDIIKYYLDEDPLIPNVPTYRCENQKQRDHVLNNIEQLVVKPANESGGYGMLIGSHSNASERAEMIKRIKADPRNFIGQPIIDISTSPTLVEGGIKPRHVDLRPFILQGDTLEVTTGGLTRVALVEGSLVVNSSQGGGSKDTWIVDQHDPRSTSNQQQ